ncbi:MAG: threonine synthase, partial [Eggerthellaceae bacterium]
MAENLYIDTRGNVTQPVPFTQAVIDGLAQGGGLYVPQNVPTLSLEQICDLAKLPYAQRAASIYRLFDVDMPAELVESLMASAYGDQWDTDQIAPIT